MAERGDRVRVTRGKNRGAVGEVFWAGEGQWGPRVGLETDDGRKVWAKPGEVDVIATDTPPGPVTPVEGRGVGLAAMAAALDKTAPAAIRFGDKLADGTPLEVAALVARIAGLELLVGKLVARVEALEGEAAPAVSAGPATPAESEVIRRLFDEPGEFEPAA